MALNKDFELSEHVRRMQSMIDDAVRSSAPDYDIKIIGDRVGQALAALDVAEHLALTAALDRMLGASRWGGTSTAVN